MRSVTCKTVLILLVAYLFAASALGQDRELEVPPVRFGLHHAGAEYREGDILGVTLEADVDAYVYVIYRQADGDAVLLFPNSVGRTNRISAKSRRQLTGDVRITAPFGEEAIQMLSSSQPLVALDKLVDEVRGAVPVMKMDDVDRLCDELAAKKALIANDTLPIKTVPRGKITVRK